MYKGKIYSCLMVLIIAASLLIPGRSSCTFASDREYKIKAAFLYNFLLFTEWKESARKVNSPKAITIGVLGENPFGDKDFTAVEGKVIPAKKKPLTIKYLGKYKDDMDLSSYHLVFIAKSEKKNLSKIFEKLDSTSALSVSDIKSFAKSGGMIELVIVKNRFRWLLNEGAINKSRLKLNSQIFRNALDVVKK